MIRTGSTDALLDNLSQNDVLRLRNISGQNWEGYSPPSSMSNYANYLDARVKCWKELKHDLVTVQTESNRRSTGLGADCQSPHSPSVLYGCGRVCGECADKWEQRKLGD